MFSEKRFEDGTSITERLIDTHEVARRQVDEILDPFQQVDPSFRVVVPVVTSFVPTVSRDGLRSKLRVQQPRMDQSSYIYSFFRALFMQWSIFRKSISSLTSGLSL
jgi:hypothetical protein